MISIICPTIPGREGWLETCQRVYCETTDTETEFIVVRNSPTCNAGWNMGIPEARGDFIHLTADDIEPEPGWWQIGMRWIEMGFIPAPRIVNEDGSLQSCGDGAWEQETGSHTELTRVPFFSREQMDKAGIYPIFDAHYYGDAWVSHKARLAGYPTVVVREMQFKHTYANVGRMDERLYPDWDLFQRAAAIRA